MGTPLSYLVLFLWVPIVVYLYKWLPSQRAVVISFIVAFQFLPTGSIPLPGLIPFGKMAATCYGLAIGILLFDLDRIKRFRLNWIDLPIIIFCLSPLASYVSNGLGSSNGFKAVFAQSMTWGAPYFLGRIYFNNLTGLRKLAVGIFIGGLTYIPFCLVENVIGPQLHLKIYGFTSFTDWSQARRWGGWRPTVFLDHGLMLATWMLAATLIGIWLWRTNVIEKVFNVPIKHLVFALLFTFIMARSTGSWGLMIFGLVILYSARWFRTSILLLILIGYISFYLYIAANGTFSSDQIISSLSFMPEDRTGSLEFRFANEELLSAKARERILFGWGGSGRNRVFSEIDGRDITVTDSYWIIIFGTTGALGLISWLTSFFLPVFAFLKVYPAKFWSHPKVAPAAVLAVMIGLYIFDCTLNAFTNPIFSLATGSLAGLVISQAEDANQTGIPLLVAENYLSKKT